MKYYLDEDISPKVAELLRRKGIDAVSVHEIEMNQRSDLEQLEKATSEGRCLVTRNRNDFIKLTVQFFNEYRAHFGILVIPHTLAGDKFSLIAEAIEKHALLNKEGMASYAIDFLES